MKTATANFSLKNLTSKVNSLILLIASLLITANVFGQGGKLPFLYLESKTGNIVEIPFTDGAMTIMKNLILVNTPKTIYEYDYDDIERFYFKDKNHLTLSDLTVSKGVLIPEFSSDIFSYTVDVPYNTSEITIAATANDSGATVTGDGLKELANGANLFTVTVTAEDGETTLNYTVTVNYSSTATGITSAVNDFDVKLYPNPTAGKFTVHIPNGFNEFELISIYNMQGQKMEDKIISGEYTDIDIKQYSTGVYFLKIAAKSGQSITKKLVKE
jgi:hypothetical protein